MRECNCGSGENSWWEYDARGIPLSRVCDKCIEEKLSGYRPEVLVDPGYWADEPIEPEEGYYA
jgi:hypothetical protein